MSFEELVQDYFEDWNQHRPDLVIGLFSEERTVEDPTLGTDREREVSYVVYLPYR
jgi:hypothetical protein